MIIGVDLDGVVFDSERLYQAFAEIEDTKRGGSGVVNPHELRIAKRYAWTEEYLMQFKNDIAHMQDIAGLLPGAKEVMDEIVNMGHTFVSVTARGTITEKVIPITHRRIEEEKIPISKVVFKQTNKVEACKQQNVDIMIDDHYDTVLKLCENGVKCLYFRDAIQKEIVHENVVQVYNWGEIYRYFKNLEK